MTRHDVVNVEHLDVLADVITALGISTLMVTILELLTLPSHITAGIHAKDAWICPTSEQASPSTSLDAVTCHFH